MVRTVRIMILETTSGGRSTGNRPVGLEGVTRYNYIQGRSKHENTRKGILKNSSPIEGDYIRKDRKCRATLDCDNNSRNTRI
jgi:hypothetical protein